MKTMSAAISRSDPVDLAGKKLAGKKLAGNELKDAASTLPAYIRAQGHLSLKVTKGPFKSTIADLYEAGGYRLKFPRADRLEASIVNTGGGMAGGDHLQLDLDMAEQTEMVVSTQSAEKIYRADGEASRTMLDVTLGDQATLYWFPQETILFDGAKFKRTLTVSMASRARFVAFEGFVFGRQAMGEQLRSVSVEDDWMIRREDRLVFAERLRLKGDANDLLSRTALGAGARMAATCVYIAPDAEARVDEARALFDGYAGHWGASAWNGLLCVRLLDREPARLRQQGIEFLQSFFGLSLPRVWQC